MSSPGNDPWAVANDAAPAASAPTSDPWGTGGQGAWAPTEDDAREAIQTIAPGATITSQARTPEHNAKVGGVADSMHLGAQATDIVLPKGVTASQLKAQLIAQGYPVTEFLDEGTHVHWGWGPKGGNPGTVPADPWAPAASAAAPNDGHWHNTPQENADLDAFEAAEKTLPPDKSQQPAASWWDTIKSAVTSTPARWKQMAGAAMQALGEHPDFLTPSNPNLSAEENEDMNAGLAPARAAAGQKMAQFGTKLYADAAADIKTNMPNLDASTAKRLAYTITSGTIDILPVLAATAVTKNPLVGGAMMGAQAGVSKYGEARADGRSPDQAAMDASFSGMVNGALGTLPLGALMKPGQTFLAKTLQSAVTFGAISVATEALQLGYDKGLVTPNMTLAQAMQRLEEAGVVGTLQGAFLGGGHAGLESAVNRLHATAPTPQARVEPAPASAPPPPEAAPAAPQAIGPVQAKVRSALGLDRPGVAPEADPWAPAAKGAAALPASAPAPEAAAVESSGIPHRALEPDVAVTSTGREVPVQYAVVEASHLVPSQTQEGNPNPAFPAELQPRDRTRAVSQAQIASIAQNINPRLLDRSVNASDGAPIVAPSGVVESGNGRSLAIQRAYADNLPSAQAYRDYLSQQGYPVEGMEQPVLVRIRTDAMHPDERQAFVREANQSGQLGYSATERAMSDAAAMPDHSMGLFRGGDIESAGNREFVRSFMSNALPANEHAAMVDQHGNLSLDGARRLRSAMLAKAYADPDLVGSVVENGDSSIKAIGNALTDASPDWALMRSGVARGEIPPALDQTGKLLEAVKLVARARQDGRNVAEFVGQPDIFTGQSIDPDVEAWLRLMFRNTKDWTQPVGRDKLAEALQFYAREAQKAQVGPNLLGEQPVSPGDVLAVAKAKQYGGQSSEQGPSLSFGEDVRARRLEGDRSGAEGAAARGGAEAARIGPEGAYRVAPFGPAPENPRLRRVSIGERAVLTGEARDYLREAGIDPTNRPEAISGLANLVYLRGKRFGFESLGTVDNAGVVTAATSGRDNFVDFPEGMFERLNDPKERIISVHNHPSSSAPSWGDVGSLAYPGHQAVVVVGHDGEWHVATLAATVLPGAKPGDVAGLIKGAARGARGTATDSVDHFYNARTVTGNEANHLISHLTMKGLERAGLIHYLGPDRIPEKIAKEADHVVDIIASNVRNFVDKNETVGLRLNTGSFSDVDRPARPVQLADGIAQILGESRQPSGQSGRAGSAGTDVGRPEVPRKPEQLRLLEEEDRYTVKPPGKLYRGTVTGQQESGASGLGTFHLGKGLYSSPDRSFAKMYGPVSEVPIKDGWPRKPLVLRGAGGAQSLLHDWIFRNTDYKNIRDFNRDYPDPGAFIRSKGYDGVIAGDEVVKYPDREFQRDQESQTDPSILREEQDRRYAEEPGAVDANGRPLPQSIIPGAEPSAIQLAKAREGRLGTKVEQKPPGGLFGAQDVPGQDQLSLFEDGRRYAEIPRDDRETLEKAARTGDWIGKYKAEGATPDARIRNAIGRAFDAWRRSGGSVPAAVRAIFSQLPRGFSDNPVTTRPTEAFSEKVKRAADAAMDLVHDAQMLIAPMAEGTNEARATAKDFANMMRLARYHGNRMMEGLKKNFDPNQRRKMWEAADEESVLRQKGEATAGRGLSTLTPDERRAVLEQQADAQNVWQAAKDQGMVQGDGLPSYVPRMMVEMARTGVQRLGTGDAEVRSIPGIGRNLKTKTGQMQHRKYMTTEETEQAGSNKFDTHAAVVRDIQTLPLATMKLREAVAGRALINKIKELGQKTGDDTVVEGHEPTGTPYKWFTLDNPAFKTWRPKLIKNEETGKYEPAKDQNGDTVFEKVPLFVRGDFEGPLRAVLSQDSGKVYNALMNMKGRAMTAIMYSPLIHNAVEWGRALPAMPGKVATFRIYFEGNRAKRDPETMTQAIMHGLVPIGHQAGMQDITSIANPESIAAGRSWTAKIVGAIPGLFSRDAKQAVYRTIDRMGDLWHNTLLWDRVGDLQMGLYTNFRDHLIAKGNSPDAAAYMAAHFANRYAGALPLESMSSTSRKLANLALFSRTYTLGNLGALKDVITGLPRDVQAQIARDGTVEQLKGVRSLAARKAIAILATDIALFYAGNSILQSAVSYIAGRQDLSEIEKGYVDRLKGLLGKVTESPMELLNPFADLQALSATSENEPGRQNRVLVGYDRNGTAIYARNPVGKIGEEFTNWLTSPLETLKAKFSTILRPTWQTLTNDAGFGRQVYDPKAKGLSGLATNLGHVISLYLSSQIPLDSLKSAAETLKGSGSEIDTYKALGPLAGVTFSKGAPGGPGVGELFELRRQQQAKQSAAMPDVIEKIKAGDIAGARKAMREVGISPGLQNYYVRVTQNPRLRLNSKSARELLRQATPEERARILQPTGAQ
jgi:hypothetical protein